VAIAERAGQPVQDCGTVSRGVVTGDNAATERLRFVGLMCFAWRARTFAPGRGASATSAYSAGLGSLLRPAPLVQ